MKLRRIIAALIAANAITPSVSAQEQPWLADRRLGEGMGIRSGDFELHPGVAAEFGYDSNYFQRANDGNPAEDKIPTWRLRVTPSISLSTLGPERRNAVAAGAPPALVLRATAWLSYNELLPADDSPESDQVSDQRHLDGGIGAHADIGPTRPLGGDLYGDYSRTGEPSNSALTDLAFDRGTARGGAGLTWRPGGGMFEWRLGGEILYNYFEDTPYDVYDNANFSILTRGRWRWLPRTAWIYDARYTMIRYTHADTPQNEGDVVEARIGQSGLITNRFAFLAMLGWNSTYFVDSTFAAQNYDGFVGHGELKWFLLPPPSGNSASVGLSSIALGAMRTLGNSYLGSFDIRDRLYANFAYFMGGVFVLNLQAGLSRVRFPASGYAGGTNPAFASTDIDLTLYGEYRFSDTFALMSTLRYDRRRADTQPRVPDATQASGSRNENIDYSRFQIWVGLRWFM